MVPVVEKAREAGLLVIALDTPLEPIDARRCHPRHGQLQGRRADRPVGGRDARRRRRRMRASRCSTSMRSEITVDYLRDQGFLKGFGIDIKDPTDIGDEDDPRIVGHDVTDGNEEGGRTAMENLLQMDPGINVVYTINEPAAAGAYEALKAFGREKDVLIVSVDGGCPGVQNVKEGVIGATSMQFPLLMASMGMEAIETFAETGAKPENSPGLDFFNTGVELITDEPVDGLPSTSADEGLEKCWG